MQNTLQNKLDDTDYTIINTNQSVIYISFLNKAGKQKEITKRQKIFMSNMTQLDLFSGRTDKNAVKFIAKYKKINRKILDEIYKIRFCAIKSNETLNEFAPFVAYEIKHQDRLDLIVDELHKHYDKEKAVRVDTEIGMEQAVDSLLAVNEEMAIDIFLSRIEMLPTDRIKEFLSGTADCIGFNLVSIDKKKVLSS